MINELHMLLLFLLFGGILSIIFNIFCSKILYKYLDEHLDFITYDETKSPLTSVNVLGRGKSAVFNNIISALIPFVCFVFGIPAIFFDIRYVWGIILSIFYAIFYNIILWRENIFISIIDKNKLIIENPLFQNKFLGYDAGYAQLICLFISAFCVIFGMTHYYTLHNIHCLIYVLICIICMLLICYVDKVDKYLFIDLKDDKTYKRYCLAMFLIVFVLTYTYLPLK